MPEPEETPPPVRQRNTTPYVFNVAETKDRPAYAVQPGEEAEFPTLLDGWTPVDAEPEVKADEAALKSPRKRAATAASDEKDGESR